MIIYHDDLRFHADEWTPLHALHSSQKGIINLGQIKTKVNTLPSKNIQTEQC